MSGTIISQFTCLLWARQSQGKNDATIPINSMRPLICPQCGGQITEYPEGARFTTCDYCETRFVIEENKAPRGPQAPVEAPEISTSFDVPPFVRVLGISVR